MSSLVPISLRDPFFDDPHFSSSRQEFEDLRRDIMHEAKEFWTRVDEDDFRPSEEAHRRASAVTPNEASFVSSRPPLSRQFNNPATALPRWFIPSSSRRATEQPSWDLGRGTGSAAAATTTGGTYSSAPSYRMGGGRDSQVLKIKEDDKVFEVTLDVQNYRPDELKIRTQPDKTVSIEGKHEERSGDDPRSAHPKNTVQNQFSRQYTLPPSCDPLKVVSNLSRDGVLIVTAPKNQPPPSVTGDRNVPISGISGKII